MLNQAENRLYYDSILASMYFERYLENTEGKNSIFQMFYIDKGYLDTKIEGETYNLTEGDMLLACPDEDIQRFSDNTVKKGIFIIHFYPEFLKLGKEDNDLFKDLLYYTKLTCRCFKVGENDLEVLEALKQINIARIDRDRNFELIMRASITRIVSWILEKQYEKAGVISENETDNVSDNIKQIIKYIDEHYMESIHLKDIADKFFVSYSHLSRMLKKATGKSFNDYIQIKKILKSTFLLVTSDEPVSEIAKKLGYCSQGYFSELFVKHNKMTPSEFRARFKSKRPIAEAYRYEYYEY